MVIRSDYESQNENENTAITRGTECVNGNMIRRQCPQRLLNDMVG